MPRVLVVASLVTAALMAVSGTAFADEPSVVRHAGSDRYATAVEVSKADFPDPGAVGVVFITVGTNFPDGLAGAAIAARFAAPVLLVHQGSVPAVTAAELARLGPQLIVILGGTSAVSSSVQAQLGSFAPQVIRVAGPNRYATAVAASVYGFPNGADEVVVVTGADFPDALTGAAAAAALGGPVLLTRPDDLPDVVRDEIMRLSVSRITLVGGTAAVSNAVLGELNGLAPTVRVAGANRYATAAAVAYHAFPTPSAWAYVAVGSNFPDALVGAAAAASRTAPVLLTLTDSLPPVTRTALRDLAPDNVAILGGLAVVGLVPEHRIAHLSLPDLHEMTIGLVEVAAGFDRPLFVTSRPADARVYVVEQKGVVWSMNQGGGDRVAVLDIEAKVACCGERGLLGIAFDPADPARLFIHYSAAGTGATTIEEHDFPLVAAAANPNPVGTVLTLPQPASNHNGGMIAFGPDGLLYVGLGDGGFSGDPNDHGQDPSTLYGSILRLDVSSLPYGIPADNPFLDGSGAPEVWVYGLRNPWRFAFDGDDLYIADVGQSTREEVSLIDIGSGGANLGWRILEGTFCHATGDPQCLDNDFVDPIFEYANGPGVCSITGGYVYRGTQDPGLGAAYFFGDFCSGQVMALRAYQGVVVDSRFFPVSASQLSSFGTDGDGNLYVTSFTGGRVYRIAQTS